MFGWYRVEVYVNGVFSHTMHFKIKDNALAWVRSINKKENSKALLSF